MGKCTARVTSNSVTEGTTKGPSSMTKKMATASTTGQMAEHTSAAGPMENNTAKALSSRPQARGGRADGRTANVSNGSTRKRAQGKVINNRMWKTLCCLLAITRPKAHRSEVS